METQDTDITWNRRDLTRLKIAYEKAVSDDLEVFTFDGHELVRSYAKYLIQYLDLVLCN